jgi:cyanate permease
MLPHMIPYMLARGVQMNSAVGMVSMMSIAMAVGTLVGGWCLDRFDTAKVAAPFSMLSTLGLLGLLFLSGGTTGIAILAASTALMGFAGGAKRPMATYFQLRFFGLRDFGGILGVQSPFLALGMGIAPPLVGLCYDRLGRYEPALLVMVGMMAATIVIYLVLGPYRFGRDLVATSPAE